MKKTVVKDLSPMAEAFFGSYKLLAQVSKISATQIFQFAPFEQIPNTLLWI